MRRMQHAFLGAIVGLALAGCASTSDAKFAAYGEAMTLTETQKVPVGKVLATPDEYRDKTILVSGVVSEVCEHKGCWIRVAEKLGDKGLFVKFTCPVEGRLIPMNALGQPTLVEGKLILEELSEGEARHYAEDAGQSPAEIAKIVGPQKRLRLQSPAARVAATPDSQPPTTAAPAKS